MTKLKVYVAGSMSGLTWEETKNRFFSVRDRLEAVGFMVFTPLLGKDEVFEEDQVLTARGLDDNAIMKESSIVNRDRWMVENSDIIFANLSGVKKASLGTCFEIAWAYASKPSKNVIAVIDKNTIHDHAFIHQCATIFYDVEEALCYLESWERMIKGGSE